MGVRPYRPPVPRPQAASLFNGIRKGVLQISFLFFRQIDSDSDVVQRDALYLACGGGLVQRHALYLACGGGPVQHQALYMACPDMKTCCNESIMQRTSHVVVHEKR